MLSRVLNYSESIRNEKNPFSFWEQKLDLINVILGGSTGESRHKDDPQRQWRRTGEAGRPGGLISRTDYGSGAYKGVTCSEC